MFKVLTSYEITHMYKNKWTQCRIYVCIYIYIHIYIHQMLLLLILLSWLLSYITGSLCIYIYIYNHAYILIQIYTYIYTRIHNIYIYIHIYKYIYIFTYIYIYIYDKMYNVHLALGLALTEVLETWSPQRSSTPCASQRVWWRPTDQRTVTGWWRNDLRLGGPKEWGDVFLYDFCRFMFVYSKDHMIWYDMN